MLLCFFLLVLDKLNLFGKQERTWQVKADAEPGPTAKKRKSEWTAALKKLPGDTTLVQDVLSYFEMFTEPSSGTGGTVAETSTHPADIVMQAFKDPDSARAAIAKCKDFLEEGMRAHGKKLEIASPPDVTSLLTASDDEHMVAMCPLLAIELKDAERVSFENLQLSTQGAERQRKDILKTAMRFERLIEERKATSTDMSESDILAELVSKYNNFRANAAIKKWQVTPAVQHLHFQKYNLWWSINVKRMKRTMRARHRWSEENWAKNVDHCALAVFAESEVRKMSDSRITEDMIKSMMESFLSGDYNQDLDAILISKPSRFSVEMLSMFQDHIAKPLMKASGAAGSSAMVDADVDVAEVLHLRDQIEIGLGLADRWMERRCLMLCTDKGQKDSLTGFTRRLLQDATTAFPDTDISHMHHLGFLDSTKFGRLGMPEINEMASWCLKVLNLNPDLSMIFICCPVLAGDGVLNGLRGEFRRIEDKLMALGMEMKNCQVVFDTRTLYRAPRGAELKSQDDNVWCKCDFWSLTACKASNPLPLSEYVTPESGTFFSHEHGRSLTDKEDGAQWFSSPSTIKSILEACLCKVSSLKGHSLTVHHFSQYDGNLEKVVCDLMTELSSECHIGCFSETTNPLLFGYASTQVKDKLLEEWKAGQGQMGLLTPKYQPEADLSGQTVPRLPALKICNMDASGNLEIPQDIRDKWISDPVRKPDWRNRLKNFDAVFAPGSGTSGEAPTVVTKDEALDLGGAPLQDPEPALVAEMSPPSMSDDAFDQKYKNMEMNTVLITMGSGQNLTCKLVDDKAKDFISKECNQNKAVEFRLPSADDFEQSPQGLRDIGPMTVYKLLVSFEKRGILDLKLTGHSAERPPAVQRGEQHDSIVVSHSTHSVFRPAGVQAAKLKGTNLAGFIGFKKLASSQYLCLVWRSLV
ncbi:unnamed protein product [Durusdinium trenchii]|uniref:Uncharacterized protein n=1 Tax=Durusdinium trenchii TaxID=1381693 RepID=A0ABP0PR44_9DINO